MLQEKIWESKWVNKVKSELFLYWFIAKHNFMISMLILGYILIYVNFIPLEKIYNIVCAHVNFIVSGDVTANCFNSFANIFRTLLTLSVLVLTIVIGIGVIFSIVFSVCHHNILNNYKPLKYQIIKPNKLFNDFKFISTWLFISSFINVFTGHWIYFKIDALKKILQWESLTYDVLYNFIATYLIINTIYWGMVKAHWYGYRIFKSAIILEKNPNPQSLKLAKIRPYIIAISGKTGAGKTTITKALSAKLGATAIFWDEYDEISKAPDDLVRWYNKGKDYSAFDYTHLAETLAQLALGQKVLCPATNKELQPTEFIIFDSPLGAMHQQTGKYIDKAFYLDTPLDVSLARWLIRDFKEAGKTKTALLKELEFYLSELRPLFTCTDVKDSCGYVIDGMLSKEEQAELIIRDLNYA